MNTIKIYLAESGRVADLRKDFPLFQGQYNDKLLNIFVPTSLLAPKFDIQHYIGQTTGSELPTDDELASFVAYNTPTHREPETGDIVEIYDVSTSKYWLYVYETDSWTSTEVDSFGSFTNITGTSIKIGCYATQRNGLIYQSKSYFVRYLKTLTYNNVEYALYERKLPKEFTKFVGEGVNAVKIVANVVNIDTESNTITSLITSQSCSLEVLPSSILDKDEAIEASDLERLEAQVSENSANIALKQDKTDPLLNTTNKTVVGAINELNTQVATNASNIGTLTNELPLKQDKTDPMLATTNKTVVGAINELNTQVGLNTGNISENAGDISDLQRRVSSLEDIAITGETYIGSMSGTQLPTDSQLNSYVLSKTGREPDGGDYIYFTLNIAFETDKNYKYTYSDVTGWSKAELPGVEKASNLEYGIVRGSGFDMLRPDKSIAITITNGQMDEVYVKDTTLTTPEWKTLPNYVNGVKTQVNTNTNNISTNAGNIAQNTLDIQANYNSIGTINGNINNIIDGTTTVGAAVNASNDGLNRNIAQTYLTQNAGATKQQLYDYALPRTFNDVLFLNASNMYTDLIPVSSNPVYTVTSSSVGAKTLFYAEDEITSPVGSSFQLSSKNSYTNTFYITASADCFVSYRLNTQIDLNGVTETLNIELTDSIEMISGQIKKISLGSAFNYLNKVLHVTPGAIITQTLEVITETSSPITFSVYSNATYPSTFYLNTTSMVLATQQGNLGELPVYELQGSDNSLNADIEFVMTDVPKTDTYAHFKLNYSKTGNTPVPDDYTVAFYLSRLNEYIKFYTTLNYGTNDLLTIGDINQGFYDYNIETDTISFTWEFDGFIQQINSEFIVNTVIPPKDTGALGIQTINTYEMIAKSNTFTTTDDFVGWYVDISGNKTLVTLANKDSLGIIPGTTYAFCKTNGGIAENQSPIYDVQTRTILAYNTHQFMDKSDIEYTLSTTSNNPIANRVIARLIPAEASEYNQLADKNYVNSRRTIYPNYSADNWQYTSYYAEYPYSSDISIIGITSNDVAYVTFGYNELSSGIFAPICTTDTDVIRIYAKMNPGTSIIIPTIVVLKEGSGSQPPTPSTYTFNTYMNTDKYSIEMRLNNSTLQTSEVIYPSTTEQYYGLNIYDLLENESGYEYEYTITDNDLQSTVYSDTITVTSGMIGTSDTFRYPTQTTECTITVTNVQYASISVYYKNSDYSQGPALNIETSSQNSATFILPIGDYYYSLYSDGYQPMYMQPFTVDSNDVSLGTKSVYTSMQPQQSGYYFTVSMNFDQYNFAMYLHDTINDTREEVSAHYDATVDEHAAYKEYLLEINESGYEYVYEVTDPNNNNTVLYSDSFVVTEAGGDMFFYPLERVQMYQIIHPYIEDWTDPNDPQFPQLSVYYNNNGSAGLEVVGGAGDLCIDRNIASAYMSLPAGTYYYNFSCPTYQDIVGGTFTITSQDVTNGYGYTTIYEDTCETTINMTYDSDISLSLYVDQSMQQQYQYYIGYLNSTNDGGTTTTELWALPEGTYYYEITSSSYQTETGTITISSADVLTGTKTVNITLTPQGV